MILVYENEKHDIKDTLTSLKTTNVNSGIFWFKGSANDLITL